MVSLHFTYCAPQLATVQTFRRLHAQYQILRRMQQLHHGRGHREHRLELCPGGRGPEDIADCNGPM
eukprot:SAG22_NODE_606_length_8615_cov_6.190348_9_plen_66_part_00